MIAKAKTYRRAKGFAPEVRLAPGPRAEAEVGDGRYAALYGYAWALILERAPARLRLFQAEVPGEGPWKLDDPRGPGVAVWVEKPLLPLPHPPAEIKHIALAWDQAARPVIAYERAGEVWVRQWDPAVQAFVVRGPFPGADPVLTVDAAMAGIEDSDAILFHLSPDRKRIILRLQRERYNTPHVVHDGTTELLLDQAMPTSWRVQVLGSPISQPDSTLAWTSAIYPYPARLKILLSSELATGSVEGYVLQEHPVGSLGFQIFPLLVGGEMQGQAPTTRDYQLAPLMGLSSFLLTGDMTEAGTYSLKTGILSESLLTEGVMITGLPYGPFLPRLRLSPSLVGGSLT